MKMVSWLASCRGLSLEWYPFQRRRQQTDGRPETELRIRIPRPSPDSPPLRPMWPISSSARLVSLPSARRYLLLRLVRWFGLGVCEAEEILSTLLPELRLLLRADFPFSFSSYSYRSLTIYRCIFNPFCSRSLCHYPAEVKEVGSRSSLVRRGMVGGNSSNESWNFQVRRLQITDKSKGFIELLQQLSVCDSVSDDEFKDRFQELSSLGDDHVICVIEDESCGKIVATGSVFIEKKFLRNCGKVGHIEDVVVDSSVRGLQLGRKIMAFLTGHARSMGCYKVILDSSVENRAFYEKCGFKQKEVQMVQYFI